MRHGFLRHDRQAWPRSRCEGVEFSASTPHQRTGEEACLMGVPLTKGTYLYEKNHGNNPSGIWLKQLDFPQKNYDPHKSCLYVLLVLYQRARSVQACSTGLYGTCATWTIVRLVITIEIWRWFGGGIFWGVHFVVNFNRKFVYHSRRTYTTDFNLEYCVGMNFILREKKHVYVTSAVFRPERVIMILNLGNNRED